MNTVEFRLFENNLQYRSLIIYTGNRPTGTNSDGDDSYSDYVEVGGWSGWIDVPRPQKCCR